MNKLTKILIVVIVILLIALGILTFKYIRITKIGGEHFQNLLMALEKLGHYDMKAVEEVQNNFHVYPYPWSI